MGRTKINKNNSSHRNTTPIQHKRRRQGKNTPEGYVRNSKYKWFYSTGIDPKAHEIPNNERKEKGKGTRENYEHTRIISTYAPTAKSNNIDTPWETKKEYYDELQNCISKINRNT